MRIYDLLFVEDWAELSCGDAIVTANTDLHKRWGLNRRPSMIIIKEEVTYPTPLRTEQLGQIVHLPYECFLEAWTSTLVREHRGHSEATRSRERTSKDNPLRVEMLVHLHAARAPRLLALEPEVFRGRERVRERGERLVHRDVVRLRVVAQVVGSDAHALLRSGAVRAEGQRDGQETEQWHEGQHGVDDLGGAGDRGACGGERTSDTGPPRGRVLGLLCALAIRIPWKAGPFGSPAPPLCELRPSLTIPNDSP